MKTRTVAFNKVFDASDTISEAKDLLKIVGMASRALDREQGSALERVHDIVQDLLSDALALLDCEGDGND